jgi:hypothetical protein
MRIAWFALPFAFTALAACSSDGKDPTTDPPGHGEPDGGKPDPDTCNPDVATPAADAFPCDVGAIIEAKCVRCHDTDEALKACTADKSCVVGPFPLVKWSDTRFKFGSTAAYELISDVVTSGFMPLQTPSISPPVEKLTAAEIKTLSDWAKACALPGKAACD